MARFKLDFKLADLVQADEAALAALKSGDVLQLLRDHPVELPQAACQGLETSTSEPTEPSQANTTAATCVAIASGSGHFLAAVPPQIAKQIPRTIEVQIFVRSIKKEPGSGKVEHMLVRAEVPPPGASKSHAAASLSMGGDGQELDPSGFQLSRTQLEQLAASEQVQMALKDERLQQLLTEIDVSKEPEKVLELMLTKDPAFEAFAEQMLQAVQVKV